MRQWRATATAQSQRPRPPGAVPRGGIHPLISSLAVIALAAPGLGCERPSNYAWGRLDGVRYQLPQGAMAIFEHADSMEALAIQPPDPEQPLRWSPEELDHADRFAVARAELLPYQRPRVINATYQSIAGGAGRGICHDPRYLVRARRGRETFEFTVSIVCLHMRIAAVDREINLDPGPIAYTLGQMIREQTQFIIDLDTGRWRHTNAQDRARER